MSDSDVQEATLSAVGVSKGDELPRFALVDGERVCLIREGDTVGLSKWNGHRCNGDKMGESGVVKAVVENRDSESGFSVLVEDLFGNEERLDANWLIRLA